MQNERIKDVKTLNYVHVVASKEKFDGRLSTRPEIKPKKGGTVSTGTYALFGSHIVEERKTDS